ncbi:MAG: GIY-YIG nuclease family protein [Deltaproteobacteria bacterium]|nr:MAG: GIY-YIG nuclease family protein [Deltaproteobacteria bacterium]
MRGWQVYLLKCADLSLYCGITNNLKARINTHNAGRGAKYTRGRLPVTLVAASLEMTKSQALKCELYIKKLPRPKKISTLIKQDPKEEMTR